MAKPPKDIAALVRARLLNLSREQEQDFQRMLVTLWTIDPGRFTQDIDFLAFDHDDEERL